MTPTTTFTGALLTALALTAPCAAEGPQVGEVQTRQVLTVSMRVGSSDKESKRVVYSPPPGWYVRSHAVDCQERTGNSSFTVNTVPQEWEWSSEDKVKDSYQMLIDLAAQGMDHGLKAKYSQERDRVLTELHKVRATHHALVVEATAKGEGFLRGGGSVQLTVTAELVYLGTPEVLTQAAARHRR